MVTLHEIEIFVRIYDIILCKFTLNIVPFYSDNEAYDGALYGHYDRA